MIRFVPLFAVALAQVNLSALLPYILQLIEDATGSKWGLLMIAVSGWVVQLLTEDSSFPISLPKAWNSNIWKPVAVVLASTAQAIFVSHFQKDVDWTHAILLGLRTAMWTMGLWALIVKAAYNGKPPWWANYLAFIFPDPTLPVPTVDRDAETLPGRDPKPPGTA